MRVKGNSLSGDIMKAIKNVNIYDYENYIENGYIIFNENIIEVGAMKDFKFQGEIIDGKGKLVIPGLVNSHTHIYSTLFRGLSLPFNPKSFIDILNQLWWKFDRELTKEDIHYSALIYGIESLKNGVTTLIDHHASGEIEGSLLEIRKAIEDELNMRVSLSFETSDRFDVEKCISENLNDSDLFGFHASISLSNETLKKTTKCIGNMPIHVHIAESLEDELDSKTRYSKTVLERFDEYDLLKKNSILAHCIHIDESEIKILEDKEVFIALNPSSNLNNNVGIFNYDLLKEQKIVIGTDGLGSNVAKEIINFNLMVKKSINSPLGIAFEKIIEIIENSYELASNILSIKIGKIKEEYNSDFLLIDYKNPTPMNNENIFSHIFYGVFENLRPEKVFVNGKEILKEYKVLIDEKSVYLKSEEASRKLFEKFEN